MKIRRLLKWTTRGLLVVFLILAVWGFVSYWKSTNDCDQKIAPTNPMKAIRFCEYGVVKLDHVEKPAPTGKQVLIKVRAASLNFIDISLIPGPWVVRPFFGLRKPSQTWVGRDVAGVVEAVGQEITEFKPGDEVFGFARGSLAEYACAAERAVAIKPANITFEQAASIPLAGLTALQGLRKGNIQAGQKILINGATGGVGTFAVQIAKALGADVTAVCSTRNAELVRSIGADRVIDYTKEDYTKSDQRYDVIFDNVCNHSFAERRRVLSPKGICVLVGLGGVGGSQGQVLGRILGNFTASGLSSFTDQKFVMYVTTTNKQDIALLGDLIQTGKVKPVLERTWKLDDAPEALRVLDQGHARGKTVITID